jgi:DNA-binding response OmpR family regulator
VRVLVAEDDAVSRRLLEVLLSRWGYDIVVAENGAEAWQAIQEDGSVKVAVLDWMMPEIDGLELCQRLRGREKDSRDYIYTIMLTAREQKEDIVQGLEAGADDYLTKPFEPLELRSRIRAGERILRLKAQLAEKVKELEDALDHVKSLQGLIPICMHCKRIRDEKQIWQRLETYIQDHSAATFSHALCDECLDKYYPDVPKEDENN